MALFKINRGSIKNLDNQPIHEGWMWITEDVGDIYVDLSSTKRMRLNAESAEKIRKIAYNADGSYNSEVSFDYDELKKAVDLTEFVYEDEPNSLVIKGQEKLTLTAEGASSSYDIGLILDGESYTLRAPEPMLINAPKGTDINVTFLTDDEGLEFATLPSYNNVILRGLTTGSNGTDAATKGYVDTEFGKLGAAAKKAVDTTIASNSTSVNLPTSQAVATFVNSANTTKVTAGDGLTGGGSAASGTGVTLNVGAGAGIIVGADAVKVALASNTKLAYESTATFTPTSTTVRPIRLDAAGNLAVVIPELKGATASAAGAIGLVPTPAAGKQEAFLRGDGTWATPFDTNTTKVTAGNGLTGGGSAASGTGVTLNVGAGVGIAVAADAVKAKLRSETALTADSVAETTASTNRIYPVVPDKSGYLAVQVPWTSAFPGAGAGIDVSYNAETNYATISIENSGVTAGNYGPSANTSPAYSGTFSVPYITVDATGRVTAASTKTITLPASSNTDTKVKQTNTTSSTKYPVLMSAQSSPTSGTSYEARYNTSVTIGSSVLYGAAWNDYAEYRETKETIEPGRVICENGDDTLSLAVERLQPGASVVSDTFGFTIGETEKAKTPIAVSGRVLVYPYEDRNSYKPGDAVCAAPNGTVSKMTREEIREYPERIVGTVSAIPEYETWGEGDVPVNGRIWIKVK